MWDRQKIYLHSLYLFHKKTFQSKTKGIIFLSFTTYLLVWM